MSKDELIEFLKENLNIVIRRDDQYHGYPELTVKLGLGDLIISEYSCTIYDGEHNVG